MKQIALILSLAILMGCAKQEEAAKPSPQSKPSPHGGGESHSAGGVTWPPPANWKEMAPKPMRIITYEIPSLDEGVEAGECAVFFFGKGEGGSIELNIERWVAQFEDATTPERSVKKMGDLKIHMVDLTGVYLAPAGPAMQSQGKKKDYRLLGAIVEAPDGLVFFKATGPASTIGTGKEDFDLLLGSLTTH